MDTVRGPHASGNIATIIAEHGGFVRRTLSQLGVPARCVPDVEQEVYRGVSRGLPTFDPSLAEEPALAMRAWLFGICERQAASHRRSEARRAETLVPVDDLDTAQDAPGTDDAIDSEERKALQSETHRQYSAGHAIRVFCSCSFGGLRGPVPRDKRRSVRRIRSGRRRGRGRRLNVHVERGRRDDCARRSHDHDNGDDYQ